MNIELIPLYKTPTSTVSILHCPGKGLLYVMEQEWNPTTEYPYGAPGNSCVPAGAYELVRANSPTYDRPMYYLQGEGVVVRMPDNDPVSRWGCMIHPGNTASDVKGCLAPGLSLGRAQVNQSAKAHIMLNVWLGDGVGHTLEVRR